MWILLNESSDNGFYDDFSINETAKKLSVYTGQPKLVLSGMNECNSFHVPYKLLVLCHALKVINFLKVLTLYQ